MKNKKIQVANETLNLISNFSSVLVCKMEPIAADAMQAFRKHMHDTVEAKIRVVKNRSIKKSADQNSPQISSILNNLQGNTILIASNDIVKMSSALAKVEQKESFTYLKGLVDGKECNKSSFEMFSQFTSSSSIAFVPIMLVLSSVSSIVNILQRKAEGNIDMNLIKEKMDAVLKDHQGSEEIKKIVRQLLEMPIMDAAYAAEMLKEILGDQMPIASAQSSGEKVESQKEEDPDTPVTLVIESVEGMNKLPAVKALRSKVKKDGAELSAVEALGMLKAGNILPEMPKSQADALISELASNNVVAKKKS